MEVLRIAQGSQQVHALCVHQMGTSNKCEILPDGDNNNTNININTNASQHDAVVWYKKAISGATRQRALAIFPSNFPVL